MAKEFNTVKKLFGDEFSEVTNEEFIEFLNWEKLADTNANYSNIKISNDGELVEYEFSKTGETVMTVDCWGVADTLYAIEHKEVEIKREHYSSSQIRYPNRVLDIDTKVYPEDKMEVKFNLWSNVKNPKKILERVITIELN